MAPSKLTGLAAATSFALLLHVGAASAQPGAAPVVEPPAQDSSRVQKWGIGLHGSSAELASSVDPDNKMQLAGGGLHVRYRINHRWGLEVSMDKIKGEYMTGVDRDSRPLTLTGMLHLTRSTKWDGYLLAGFGGSRDLVTSTDPSGREIEIEYRQTHIHLGGGLEYRWSNFGISAEVRLIGAARNEDFAQGAPLDGPVPEESSGGMFSMGATYYF